jgi:cobaltochelatase CobN
VSRTVERGTWNVEPGIANVERYQPRRNIVHREDGRPVNVARSRGQLFVCANNCCCGRVEDGIPAVPTDLYHAEWERRRLRNIVHLTIGGCLGPCALANVALLLFDGEALWFHSVNSSEVVLALFDYVEAMLDADALLPAPAPLAALQFTAHTWQARPDSAPVDDHRQWQKRKEARGKAALTPRPPLPMLGEGETCQTATPGLQPVQVSPIVILEDQRRSGTPLPGLGEGPGVRADRVIADMEGAAAAPRRNGELVFAEPWEGRAFGMAVALNESRCYPWEDFRRRLIAEIAAADAGGDGPGYYERWLAAFEQLLSEQGLVSHAELDERTFEFEFGERDEVF